MMVGGPWWQPFAAQIKEQEGGRSNAMQMCELHPIRREQRKESVVQIFCSASQNLTSLLMLCT